jgi:hypothetical protein
VQKQVLDRFFYLQLEQDEVAELLLELKPIEVITKDNKWDLFVDKEAHKNFLGFHSRSKSESAKGKAYKNETDFFFLVIQLQSVIEYNERSVYKILDLVGDIGGFNDALVILVEILFGSYASTSLMMSLVADTFLHDKADMETPRNSRSRRAKLHAAETDL